MKKAISLATSALYSMRRLLFNGPPGIRILMYHRVEPNPEYDQLNVPPEQFKAQMTLLSENYTVITLDQAVKELKSGVDERNEKPKVVITFDDGYLDNLTHALPILEELNLPATIFITTEFSDQTLTHPRYKGDRKQQHLNWQQLEELNKNPLITLGSHTKTHPFLSEIDDKLSEQEILESKTIIEEKLGTAIDYFCYPSGNYSQRELDTLIRSRYRAAVTVKPGSNSIETPSLELRRTEVTSKDTPYELKKKLAGAYDLLHLILDAKRERQFKKRQLAAKSEENAL